MAKSTINFDNLDTSQGDVGIGNGYAGLNWSNFYALDPDNDDLPSGSGYSTGRTSGSNVAYTAYGDAATVSAVKGTFDLKSVELTAAWDKKETVEITGYDASGNTLYDEYVQVKDSGPKNFKLNFHDVASVTFTPLGGKEDPNFPDYGDHIVFDDMVVSGVKGGKAAAASGGHYETAAVQDHSYLSHSYLAHSMGDHAFM